MLALLINFDDNSVSFADAVFPAEHPAKTIHINSIVIGLHSDASSPIIIYLYFFAGILIGKL